MGRYRLLTGKHVQGRGDAKVWYKPGSIVESKVNLIERFGPKFGLVESGEVSTPVATREPTVATDVAQREELERLSNKELREFAESEKIDVSTCSRKEEYVNAILAALGERGVAHVPH